MRSLVISGGIALVVAVGCGDDKKGAPKPGEVEKAIPQVFDAAPPDAMPDATPDVDIEIPVLQ